MIAKLVNIYKYKLSAAYSGRYVKTSCVCSANLEEGGTTNRGGAVPSDSGFACGASKVSFFNSWVRLEVKKPRWGSSNKCYPVIQKNGWFELKKTIQIDDLSVLPFEETSGSEGTIRGKALHILEDLGVNKHQ